MEVSRFDIDHDYYRNNRVYNPQICFVLFENFDELYRFQRAERCIIQNECENEIDVNEACVMLSLSLNNFHQ